MFDSATEECTEHHALVTLPVWWRHGLVKKDPDRAGFARTTARAETAKPARDNGVVDCTD